MCNFMGHRSMSKTDFQLKGLEKVQGVGTLEGMLEYMVFQKIKNDPTSTCCKWLCFILKNLSNESFEDFQVDTFALIQNLKHKAGSNRSIRVYTTQTIYTTFVTHPYSYSPKFTTAPSENQLIEHAQTM